MGMDLNVFTPITGAKPHVEMRDNQGETKVVSLNLQASRDARLDMVFFMNRGKEDIRDLVNALHAEAKKFLDDASCDDCGQLLPWKEATVDNKMILCPACYEKHIGY